MSDQQIIEVQSMRALSATLRSKAIQCEETGDLLSRQRDLYWKCEAAQHFKSGMKKSKTTLAGLAKEFLSLADELDRRADLLDSTQR